MLLVVGVHRGPHSSCVGHRWVYANFAGRLQRDAAAGLEKLGGTVPETRQVEAVSRIGGGEEVNAAVGYGWGEV